MSQGSDMPQQAAAIAIRREADGVHVCLIRRKGSEAWGIPKGLVDPGDTLEQTALNEAREEAGLEGRLIGDPLGTYEHRKWGTAFAVTVYLMEVLDQQPTWQESRFREHRWAPFDEAASLLAKHPVRPLLKRARGTLADGVA